MLSRNVKAWADNFYFKGVGLPVQDIPESDEVKVQEEYLEFFAHPVASILHRTMDTDLTVDEVKMFMFAVSQSKIVSPYYLIPVIDSLPGVGKREESEELSDFLNRVSSYCEANLHVVYMACTKNNTFKAYADRRSLTVGTFPNKPIVLGKEKSFKQPPILKRLIDIPPSSLNDYCILALKSAVSSGIVNEAELRKEKYSIVQDGKVVQSYVTAISPELPSYFVRKLIADLPQATIASAPSQYHAALDYAEDHASEYRVALHELRDIMDTIIEDDEPQLNDKIVMEYLHERFDIPITDLQEVVLIPTAKKLYTSSYLLSGQERNMSAEEFVDYINDNQDAATGTLDELIEAFCREENFSTMQTVENLIRFINDEPLDTSVLNNEQFASTELTQPEVNPETVVLNFLDTNVHIGEGLKKLIRDAILYDKDVEVPTAIDILKPLELPSYILDSIVHAASTNRPAVIPKQEIEQEDVSDYLVRIGIPRTLATPIISGELPLQKMLQVESEKDPSIMDKTIYEYVNNLEHQDQDDFINSWLLSWIEENPDAGELTLYEFANHVDHVTFEDRLRTIDGMPEDLLQQIVNAVSGATAFTTPAVPTAKEILALEVSDNPNLSSMTVGEYLTGVPVDAISQFKDQLLNTPGMSHDMAEAVAAALSAGGEFGIPKSDVLAFIQSDKDILSEVSGWVTMTPRESDDKIYNIASKLILDVRTILNNTEGYEIRIDAIPTYHSMVKLMAATPAIMDNVIEFIENRKAEIKSTRLQDALEAVIQSLKE